MKPIPLRQASTPVMSHRLSSRVSCLGTAFFATSRMLTGSARAGRLVVPRGERAGQAGCYRARARGLVMKPIPQHQCMTPRTIGVTSRVRTGSPALIAIPPTVIATR